MLKAGSIISNYMFLAGVTGFVAGAVAQNYNVAIPIALLVFVILLGSYIVEQNRKGGINGKKR